MLSIWTSPKFCILVKQLSLNCIRTKFDMYKLKAFADDKMTNDVLCPEQGGKHCGKRKFFP